AVGRELRREQNPAEPAPLHLSVYRELISRPEVAFMGHRPTKTIRCPRFDREPLMCYLCPVPTPLPTSGRHHTSADCKRINRNITDGRAKCGRFQTGAIRKGTPSDMDDAVGNRDGSEPRGASECPRLDVTNGLGELVSSGFGFRIFDQPILALVE